MIVRTNRRMWVALAACLWALAVMPAAHAEDSIDGGGFEAMTSWDGCAATGYHCVYKNDTGATGGVKAFAGNITDYSGWTFDGCTLNCGVNDNVSSVWNRESYNVRMFIHASYSGSAYDVGSGVKVSSFTSFYNDAFSSHRDW